MSRKIKTKSRVTKGQGMKAIENKVELDTVEDSRVPGEDIPEKVWSGRRACYHYGPLQRPGYKSRPWVLMSEPRGPSGWSRDAEKLCHESVMQTHAGAGRSPLGLWLVHSLQTLPAQDAGYTDF